MLDPDILARAQALGLAARGIVEGLRVGDHRSPFRGFSVEFVQHREYVPGDDVRHIDWRGYARTERYTVKQYQQETNFAGHLLLDASGSMGYGRGMTNKLECGKVLAATLAYVIIQQRDSAALNVFAGGGTRLPASAQPGHLQAVLQTLAAAGAGPAVPVAAVLNELAGEVRRRGLVFLISDCFDAADAVLDGLRHLRFKGHEVTLFHVLHPDELHFPFTGNVRFLGMELPREVMTRPHQIRPAYLRAVRAFCAKLRHGCEAAKVDYVLVDTGRPLVRTLSEYLAQRISHR